MLHTILIILNIILAISVDWRIGIVVSIITYLIHILASSIYKIQHNFKGMYGELLRLRQLEKHYAKNHCTCVHEKRGKDTSS